MPSKMTPWKIIAECQGDCEFHYGKVKKVNISLNGNPFDETQAFYCRRAVEKDISRGFEISESHFENFGE